VRENGVVMVVDLLRGQKTGAFLDQRDNRRRVRELARGRRVLNLFSYAGGFSTAAVLGGATHVTSVDLAQAAHATAQASMRANGIDPSAHAFVTADAFVFLETAHKKGQRWDLVVSDPPSFAPNEKSRPRALTAYRRLHGACAAVLGPRGILCASSCSSHVSAEDFATTLDDAATGRSDLSLVEMHGPPWDHPTLPAWPEGRYLKFAVLV
jgi:23S rRNA (cytosine1962-C5)-methyltransferase